MKIEIFFHVTFENNKTENADAAAASWIKIGQISLTTSFLFSHEICKKH